MHNLKINSLDLRNLNLKHFTELDAELYCQLSGINPDNIKILYLHMNNNLTDISGISIFKNVTYIDLESNKELSDLSSLKNLTNLKSLYLRYINITDISQLQNLFNLEILDLNYNNITDINPLKNLVNLKVLYINNLNFTDESDAVNILKNLPNLKELYCFNTFKTVKIKNELKRKDLEIND